MTYYFFKNFPAKVISTLGAGDAFSSTFFAALNRRTSDIGRALMYGSVNSASVVSKFGASDGFLTFEEIENKLSDNPDFTYIRI